MATMALCLSITACSSHGGRAADARPAGSPSGSTSQIGTTNSPAGGLGRSDWRAYVARENALPGTRALISKSGGMAPGLDAYADRVSVLPGESVGLYVSGVGIVHAQALRIGYYGGVGTRVVWQGSFPAVRQAAPRALTAPIPDAGGAAGTDALYAPWKLTHTVSTTGWPEGAYLIRLDVERASRYVMLTVRSASAVGRVLLINAPMTWQAYNTWGGRGLYGDEAKDFARRSLAVSFDRPYADGYGSGRFLSYDAPVDRLAQKLDLPLAWATDYDVALNPHLLDGAVAIVVGGHAEYWTGPMRDAVVAQVNRGTNLAVFGANTAYWRVRLAGRQVPVGVQTGRQDGRPRLIFGAKDAQLDPLAIGDPAGATARFRDPPHPRLEEALTGMRYDCFPAQADWVVADATWWGYAGTGLHDGSRLQGVVGPESDRVYPVATRPRPLDVVAYTRLPCGAGGGVGARMTAQTGVYFANAAGAGVFVTGTMRWPTLLDDVHRGATLTRISATVLTAFAAPHAGTAHPPHENVSQFWLPTAVTSGAA